MDFNESVLVHTHVTSMQKVIHKLVYKDHPLSLTGVEECKGLKEIMKKVELAFSRQNHEF